MKILFVRPPRYMWPWNSESSSFWQPLGFASIAAVLRENEFDVEILDCLPLHIGWKSLKKKLETKDFDILCVGDETASFYESVKLAKYIKKIRKEIIIVGGGYFFGNLIEESLNKYSVDFVVKGEGEITLLELVKEINNNKKEFSKIKGIAFKDKNEKIIVNRERPLIKNLDSLPFPAYDLLPMNKYGQNSKNHKDFIAMEHGRGCSGGCNFCSIWNQMKNGSIPCYRTKSAKRCFEETKYLVKKYKRKTINWVDGTFNLDPKWSKEYFELLEKEGIKVKHTAWMRADCIVRDEKLGIMKNMVKNGLVQAIVGLERLKKKDQENLGLNGKEYGICKEAFRILKRYNKVYTIATMVYGLPDDNWEDLRQIQKFIYKNIVDFQFILPFTPYPGTKLWEIYKDKMKNLDFRTWNLHRPVMGTKYLTRKQLDSWFKECLLKYMFQPSFYIRNFTEKDKRKKRIHWSLTTKLFKGLFRGIADMITGNKELEYGRKPEWYDS